MNYYSICKKMTEDAKRLPEDKNIRLFLRHSIRYDNPPDGNYERLLLTPEGIELAKKMGKSIDRPVGTLYSSPVKRCQQTLQYMAEGLGRPELELKTVPEYASIIGYAYAAENLGVSWYEYYYSLQRGLLEKTNGVTLQEEAKRILDVIFAEEGETGTLDLICSHDSHVIILASALFDLKTGINGENWCEYTEGLFFYGKRNDFTALWRGEEKQFKDFIL